VRDWVVTGAYFERNLLCHNGVARFVNQINGMKAMMRPEFTRVASVKNMTLSLIFERIIFVLR